MDIGTNQCGNHSKLYMIFTEPGYLGKVKCVLFFSSDRSSCCDDAPYVQKMDKVCGV